MIIITLPGQRARNFNNRTTAWMWLKKMNATWASGRRMSTLEFMDSLNACNTFHVGTKHGEALITQEVRP